MISRIRDLWARAERPAPGRRAADELRLAAAALLVEAARMDGEFGAAERETVLDLLEHRFELTPEEARELLEMAVAAAMRSTQLFAFTQAVKNGYDAEERIAMIEMLWEVAYADGALHDYEANLLRRVAGLIHVPDPVSGAARKRVLARLGLDG
jgi:uncharacterized tellurite resistance protein B-like protein